MRSPWISALINPLNLAMLAAGVGAGLISAWWLFPAGILFWISMVLIMVFDPAVRINRIIQERVQLTERFQQPFKRIERVQVSLFNSLASAKTSTKRLYEPLQNNIRDLVDQIYQLCLKLTPLENYRLVNNKTNPENELNQLQRLVENIEDPLAKNDYESAIQALQEKVNQEKITTARLSRLDALLIDIANEMEGLLSEAINIRSLPSNELKSKLETLVWEVQQEKQKLQGFE